MSYDIVIEDSVPPFTRRVGDYTVQGSNNTIIILGTDRAKKGPATIDDGLGHTDAAGGGKGTGTIHLIAGRQDKNGDPDFEKDSSFVYLSMKTDVDDNLGLSGVQQGAKGAAAAVVKADSVRIVFRKDLKISIADGSTYMWMKKDEIILDSNAIKLGDGATERLVLGDKFKTLFNSHQHPTGTGPSGPPTPDGQVQDSHLSQRKVTVK